MQLCKEKERVCAVGDDSQSIYSFRGANIDNILSFQSRFKGAKLFKLEQNYRSTQNIVEAANSLIKHNSNQIPKDVYSKNDKGECLVYKPAYSDKEEALIVCREIKRIKRQDDCQYSDFAILYRTNAQSRSFEEEFRNRAFLIASLVDSASFSARRSRMSSLTSVSWRIPTTRRLSSVSSTILHVESAIRPWQRLLPVRSTIM